MKLWEPSGCCCFSLRTGSLVLATLNIVGGLISLLNAIGSLVFTDIHAIIEEVCKEDKDFEDPNECIDLVTPVALGLIIGGIVLDAISVIISSLLVHGILKQKTTYMIPIMIVSAIFIGITILGSMAIVGFFLYLGAVSIALVCAIVLGCIIFLYTYFLLVIRALYLQIRRSKGKEHVVLTEQGYHGVKTEGE